MQSPAEMIEAAEAAARMIDADVLSIVAKSAQLDEIAEARGDGFAAYWAGSVSSSVVRHYRVGAYVDVVAR